MCKMYVDLFLDYYFLANVTRLYTKPLHEGFSYVSGLLYPND